MDFELRRAQQRYEKEQREKREAARLKAERQRKAKEEIEARRRAIEEAQRLKRLEDAAAAEAARRQAEADLQAGGGIRFNRELIPVAIAGDRDKITLPQSVLSDLPLDEALDRGPMLFELSVPRAAGGSAAGGSATGGSTADGMEVDGEEEDDADEGGYAVDVDLNGGDYNGRRVKRRVTHGGVLEFTAPEGCVGLPPLILRNLGLTGIMDVFNPSGTPPSVRVRFVKLPKATFARLQPLRHGFLADVANHRAVLEAALRGQAALTRGDVLLIGSEVGEVAVRVCEVKGVGGARGAATVIDADVEIELSPWEAEGGAEGKGGMGNRQGEGKGEGKGKGKEGEMRDAGRDGKNVGDGGWAMAGTGRKLRETDEQQGETREKGEEAEGGGRGVGAGVVKREVIHVGSADRRLLVLPIGGKGLAGEIQEGEWRYFKVYVDGRLGRRLYQGEVELEFRLQLEGGSADVARGGGDVAEGDADLYLTRHPIVYPSFLDHDVSRADLESGGEHHQHCGECGEVFGGRKEREKHKQVRHGELVCECGLTGKAAEVTAVAPPVPVAPSSIASVLPSCRPSCLSSLPPSRLNPPPPAPPLAHHLSPPPHPLSLLCCPRAGPRPAPLRYRRSQRPLTPRGALWVLSHINLSLPHLCPLLMFRLCLPSHFPHLLSSPTLPHQHHHRRTTCPHRPILCRFCAALVPALGPPLSARDRLNGLSPHEAQCGARTAPCDTCRRPVMLKEMDVHVAAFHSLPATSAASPAAATANSTTAAAAAAASPGNAPASVAGGRSTHTHTDMDDEHWARAYAGDSVAVGGGRGTHTHTDMDEEHWARAYAGDFEEDQGLQGRVGDGMVGDVGNVGARGGNLDGGLEKRDGPGGASGLPASLAALSEEALLAAREAAYEQQLLAVRASNEGTAPIGQAGGREGEGEGEEVEGEAEEEEEEEDEEEGDRDEMDGGDDAMSDEFGQETGGGL
ncbi:unnamed protein product [Closterium sp. Naga37s-1]|nr:unnamed protein product [Closterium sp. Naga37s-1]